VREIALRDIAVGEHFHVAAILGAQDALQYRLNAIMWPFEVLEKARAIQQQNAGDIHAPIEVSGTPADLPDPRSGKPSNSLADVTHGGYLKGVQPPWNTSNLVHYHRSA